MDNIKFYTIPGRPKPLQRVRFSNGRAYDPQAKEKELVRQSLFYQHGLKESKITGPVHMVVDFYMPLSGTKAQKKAKASTWHYGRPDTSNLIKFIEDAAIGALFEDDCIIAMITARKIYCPLDSEPMTTVAFWSLEEKHEIDV